MSLQPAIPWWVALQQRPPPFYRPTPVSPNGQARTATLLSARILCALVFPFGTEERRPSATSIPSCERPQFQAHFWIGKCLRSKFLLTSMALRVADLVSTLQELTTLGVDFISLTAALNLTTPAGGAMAGLLSVFAGFEKGIMRERVRAGLAHARLQGNRLGRPPQNGASVGKLFRARRQRIRDRPAPWNRTNIRWATAGTRENLRNCGIFTSSF